MPKYFFARRCNACRRGMNAGYVVNDGEQYACSDACLDYLYIKNAWGTIDTYLSEYDDAGDSYWTQWEPCDGLQFESENADGSGAVPMERSSI